MRSVAVLDHGMGNLRSVAKALEAAGARATVTAEVRDLSRHDALCVPGQGIFGRCIDDLTRTGAGEAILEWLAHGRPYLGICLGMQILFEGSEEDAERAGLGHIPGRVTKLSGPVRVPHIGWNTVGDAYYYFDHSYAAHPDDASVVKGWCEHGDRFAAHVEVGPVTAVQFHPEKSSSAGIGLLKEWLTT